MLYIISGEGPETMKVPAEAWVQLFTGDGRALLMYGYKRDVEDQVCNPPGADFNEGDFEYDPYKEVTSIDEFQRRVEEAGIPDQDVRAWFREMERED